MPKSFTPLSVLLLLVISCLTRPPHETFAAAAAWCAGCVDSARGRSLRFVVTNHLFFPNKLATANPKKSRTTVNCRRSVCWHEC
jgi:hypothetical protein